MTDKNTGGPAFPVAQDYDERVGAYIQYASDGMTLRDYFAAKAMQGVLSGTGLGHMNVHPSYYDSLAGTAKTAYLIADAMLEARQS